MTTFTAESLDFQIENIAKLKCTKYPSPVTSFPNPDILQTPEIMETPVATPQINDRKLKWQLKQLPTKDQTST